MQPDVSHTVMLPNGDTITSAGRGQIDCDSLPIQAREAIIFKDEDLPHNNLVSVSQLVNAGMKVGFDKHGATVSDSAGKSVLRATHENHSGLFIIKDDLQTNSINVLFPKSSSRKQKNDFYVAALGSLTTSIVTNALSRGWLALPGLTTESIRNHPHSLATSKGHLDRTRSGLDSTDKQNDLPPNVSADQDKVIYSDLTGRFQHTSPRGVEYLMVMRCSYTNYIHVVGLKSRSANDFNRAYREGVDFYRRHGVVHTKAVMDNETSDSLRELLRGLGITPQFVPPFNHR